MQAQPVSREFADTCVAMQVAADRQKSNALHTMNAVAAKLGREMFWESSKVASFVESLPLPVPSSPESGHTVKVMCV